MYVLMLVDIQDHIFMEVVRTLWSGVYYPKGIEGDENLDDLE